MSMSVILFNKFLYSGAFPFPLTLTCLHMAFAALLTQSLRSLGRLDVPAFGWPLYARAVLPILLGVVPFAMITGVAAVGVGLSPLDSFGMSVIVFAGAYIVWSAVASSTGVRDGIGALAVGVHRGVDEVSVGALEQRGARTARTAWTPACSPCPSARTL